MYKFYIRMDGEVFGPYSAKGMSELGLLPDIMVTENNMDSWVTAGSLDFTELAKQELLEKLNQKAAQIPSDGERSYEDKKEALKKRLSSKMTEKNSVEALHQKEDSVTKNYVTFPAQIEFKANFNEGINSIGGKLIITPTQLIFKAHSLNFGDLSDRVFNITDIYGYEKGILTFMYILFKDGRKIKLTVWDKQGIINELEARRNTL
ncbi:MAG: hypothetical protein NC453_10770 [Muribaculum sp.]|nr:hypothetical protein [Muribaculum sp.]